MASTSLPSGLSTMNLRSVIRNLNVTSVAMVNNPAAAHCVRM